VVGFVDDGEKERQQVTSPGLCVKGGREADLHPGHLLLHLGLLFGLELLEVLLLILLQLVLFPLPLGLVSCSVIRVGLHVSTSAHT
jgi:hypothetical protein